ncbi:MAG: translocation/assembly module TamB domain-containing protein, partial [Parasynechococcus sp.]
MRITRRNVLPITGGLLLISAGVVGLHAIDRWTAAEVDRWRPTLERSLAGPVGHPILIGPYQGLRPFGLAFGPSRISPSAADPSQVRLAGFTVTLDPLASLRRWKPVVALKFRGLEAQLQRNDAGSYWTFGGSNSKDPPPNLELRYSFAQPARFTLKPGGDQLALQSRGAIRLDDSSFQTSSSLSWLGQAGTLRLDGSGRWDRPQFDLRSRAKSIQLVRLATFMPLSADAAVGGQLDGDLRLRWSGETLGCEGDLNINRFQVQTTALPSELRSGRIRLECQKERVQLAPVQMQSGDLTATASGSIEFQRRLQFKLDVRRRSNDDALNVQIAGPWAAPTWRVAGRFSPKPTSTLQGPISLQGDGRVVLDPSAQRRLVIRNLGLKALGARLAVSGELGQRTQLRSTEFSMLPAFWDQVPSLQATLGGEAPVEGELSINGPIHSLGVQLKLAQAKNPLLDRWSLKAQWSAARSVLDLDQFSSPLMRASSTLPLAWSDGMVQTGDLQAGLEIQSFDLQRLSALVGTPLGGTLSVRGRLAGPLEGLQPNLAISLDQPRVSSIALSELWSGRFEGVVGEGSQLEMASASSFAPGALTADFAANGWPASLRLKRGGGFLQLKGDQRGYRWDAAGLTLDGIQVAIPTQQRFVSVGGKLNGAGQLAFAPLSLKGRLTVEAPRIGALAMQKAVLEGGLQNSRFEADAVLSPPLGSLTINAKGGLKGALNSRVDASGLDVNWLLDVSRQLRGPDRPDGLPLGRADDLGTLVINTFGGSLDGQLKALIKARQALRVYALAHPDQGPQFERLEGRLDAVATLKGPRLRDLVADVQAKAHLWTDGDDQAQALQLEPLVATVKGPLFGGAGTFSFLHLPFSLLALIAPVPPMLKGALGAKGSYELSGESPLIRSSLNLESATLGDQPLRFERDSVVVQDQALRLDLALRSGESDEVVSIRGAVPFDPSSALNLQIESHGDALNHLAALSGGSVKVQAGSSDLRLILRGSLTQPVANGFVVVSDGNITVGEQSLSRINASLLFDFDRLELQRLEARVGTGGSLSGAGSIGLLREQTVESPLTFAFKTAKIRQEIARYQVDGTVIVKGALARPLIGGELTLSHGLITPRSGVLAKARQGGLRAGLLPANQFDAPDDTPSDVSMINLIEEKWDFKDPLVLMGPGTPLPASQERLKTLMPNLPAVRFQNLRLVLGSNLEVKMPPFISFRGGGQLLLNGPLDPSLQARGLIRLESGRVSLFTTTFLLDAKASNVAVFTPSLGLVPYVDVAMKARVSDGVSIGESDRATTSNVFETNGLGALSIGGGQLNLVRITVEATGRADRLFGTDRLMGDIKLRSSPPMGRAEILGLIGGNSLTGLAGGGSAALATVVGQSLLSPVIGTLTDALGQRMQIALFPTYVTPDVKSEEERTSGRVPPTFTVVTEIGLDVSDRFDLSVIAAPNNTDVPPQATVSYQLTPNTNVTGSI